MLNATGDIGRELDLESRSGAPLGDQICRADLRSETGYVKPNSETLVLSLHIKIGVLIEYSGKQ